MLLEILTVLHRRLPNVPFELRLKMTLAGKAEIAADLAKGFFRESKQRLCFLYATLRDISADPHSQLLLKFPKQIRPAHSGKSNDIFCLNWFIDMGIDKLHTGVYFM